MVYREKMNRGIIVKIINRIVVIIALLTCFILVMYNGNSVDEILSEVEDKPIVVIHQEEVEKGMIVFYQQTGLDNEYVSFAYLRNQLFDGYKLETSGIQEMGSALNRYGVSFGSLPGVVEDFPTVCFGLLENDEIVDLKVIEKSRIIEQEVRIINTGEKTFWISELESFQGTEWILLGLDKDGEKVVKIETNL